MLNSTEFINDFYDKTIQRPDLLKKYNISSHLYYKIVQEYKLPPRNQLYKIDKANINIDEKMYGGVDTLEYKINVLIFKNKSTDKTLMLEIIKELLKHVENGKLTLEEYTDKIVPILNKFRLNEAS